MWLVATGVFSGGPHAGGVNLCAPKRLCLWWALSISSRCSSWFDAVTNWPHNSRIDRSSCRDVEAPRSSQLTSGSIVLPLLELYCSYCRWQAVALLLAIAGRNVRGNVSWNVDIAKRPADERVSSDGRKESMTFNWWSLRCIEGRRNTVYDVIQPDCD